MSDKDIKVYTNTNENLGNDTRFEEYDGAYDWLQIGCYVKSTDEEKTVRIVKNLRFVDDELHSVVMLPHPIKDDRYDIVQTVEEFYLNNVYEPNGPKIREMEIAAVNNKIASLQKRLTEKPDVHVAGLIEDGNKNTSEGKSEYSYAVPAVRATDAKVTVTAGSLRSRAGDVKTFKARMVAKSQEVQEIATWARNISNEIEACSSQLAGFYQEKASTAVASIQHHLDYAEEITKNMETFSLYTGDSVTLNKIKSGKPAASDQKLHIFQEKLWMDEECLINAIYEGIEEGQKQLFFDMLNNDPSLVDRVLPYEKCVVLMGYSRQYRSSYEGLHELVVHNIMERNKEGFLLIRNGENIYTVDADIAVPTTNKLFPDTAAGDDIFTGMDGSAIKMEDLQYYSSTKKHEAYELHFRRLLIALWGLNDIQGIFGPEWQQHMPHFGSLEFQKTKMVFIRDADSNMKVLGNDLPPYEQWLKEKNETIGAGSRVLCNWSSMIDSDSAKACYSRSDRCFQQYYPTKPYAIKPARLLNGRLYVEVEVKDRYNFDEKIKTTKVWLDKCYNNSFIVLDDVSADHIDFFFNSRRCRASYINNINCLMYAREHLIEEREWESDFRKDIQSFIFNKLPTLEFYYYKKYEDSAISKWRKKNSGKALPRKGQPKYTPAFKEIKEDVLNNADPEKSKAALAGYKNEETLIEAMQEKFGEALVKITQKNNGYIVIYTEASDCSVQKYYEKCPWLYFEIMTKTGKVNTSGYKHAVNTYRGETTLYESDKLSEYKDRETYFSFRYNEEVDRIKNNLMVPGSFTRFFTPTPEQWEKTFWDVFNQIEEESTLTKNGYAYVTTTMAIDPKHLSAEVVYIEGMPWLALTAETDDQIKKLENEIVKRYRYSQKKIKKLKTLRDESSLLTEATFSVAPTSQLKGLDWVMDYLDTKTGYCRRKDVKCSPMMDYLSLPTKDQGVSKGRDNFDKYFNDKRSRLITTVEEELNNVLQEIGAENIDYEEYYETVSKYNDDDKCLPKPNDPARGAAVD